MTRQTAPIHLYSFPTPNGQKISVALEEFELPYEYHRVDITKGEQFAKAFLAISPNNRIPAIVDPEGPDGEPISVFESGAILQYLGDKFERFYPKDARTRVAVNEWLFWQVGGVGPMFGQYNHFARFAKEKIPYGITRYHDEVKRLYGVLDRQLADRQFVAGDYSIADMSLVGWTKGHENYEVDMEAFPNVLRWLSDLLARPAVQRGLELGRAKREAETEVRAKQTA